MDKEVGEGIGIISAALTGFTLWMAKAGKIGGGCPDPSCKQKIQEHSEQLASGKTDFAWIKKELEETKALAEATNKGVAELNGYIKGLLGK